MHKKFEKKFFVFEKVRLNFSTQLSLLRREYLLSAVNVLKKSLKTLHLIKNEFFPVNYLHSDPWIW